MSGTVKRVQLINYDLNKEKNDTDRNNLRNHIVDVMCGMRLTDSTYTIYTALDAKAVFDELWDLGFIDSNDYLFVFPLLVHGYGYGAQESVNWLNFFLHPQFFAYHR